MIICFLLATHVPPRSTGRSFWGPMLASHREGSLRADLGCAEIDLWLIFIEILLNGMSLDRGRGTHQFG